MAAPKKKAGTGVTVWQDQMREAAKKQATTEVVSGSFRSISTKSGVLSVDDTPLKDNELRCIVLMTAHENQYYAGAYSPNVTQIPACYAFSEPDGGDEDMAPHTDSEDKQNATCDGCWANEMGSAETGRGKACKNIRRLAIVTESDMGNATTLDEAEVRMLKVSVTSVKNWAKHVHRVAEEMERPSWGVITLIKLVPDIKTQHKLTFTFEGLVEFDQPLMDAVQRKRGELAKEITLPYQQPTEQTPPARSRQNTTAKKPAARLHQPPARGKPAPAARRGGKY